MPIAEPLSSPLWMAVQGRVRWPTADEDVTTMLGRDWEDAVAAFQYAASSTKELPDTAWPDEVGAVFDERIRTLRDDVYEGAEAMARLARITHAYGADIAHTKGEILRVLDSWDVVYRQRPEVAGPFAGIMNGFLGAMAARIRARGAAGPDAADPARPMLPTPEDVVALAAAPPPGSNGPRQIMGVSQQQLGHVRGTPQFELRKNVKPTSYFLDRGDANRYTYDAWYRGTPVKGDPMVREYDFGKVVGYGAYGGAQTRVTVVMDKNGYVHGYPSGPEIPR